MLLLIDMLMLFIQQKQSELSFQLDTRIFTLILEKFNRDVKIILRIF